MCRGKQIQMRTFYTIVFVMLALSLVINTMSVNAVANQPSHQQDLITELDGAIDGKFSRYLDSINSDCSKQLNQSTMDFLRAIRVNNDARDVYRELITNALVGKGSDEWGSITKTCPKSVLLEALLGGAQPGGPLEGVFLNDVKITHKTGQGGIAKNHLTISDTEHALGHWAQWGNKVEIRPDFSLYYKYLSDHDHVHAAPLIEYMILRDPDMAVDLLFELYPDQFDAPLDVFHEVSVIQRRLWEVRTRLTTDEPGNEIYEVYGQLCGSPDWWIRLYALSIVDQDPWIERWLVRSPQLHETMRRDQIEVVRLVANQIAKRNGLGELRGS